MTLQRCKSSLLELIEDHENRVIALSGKWGTGKTYLWRQVRDETTDASAKDAISVSLFGVSTINDLKLKIVQAVVPKLKNDSRLADAVSTGFNGIKKVLKSVHSGFSALDEFALLATPYLLKGRFIVIDDIERKHSGLSIDEILGFIDDCVLNYDCRILLVLNSDKLNDKLIWEQFREKVIDQELRLDTTPTEAFDIASALTSTPWTEHLKRAVESCGVTNIRIIRKIIRVANRLLGDKPGLAPLVISRVIPSTTLLSAIHYKGLEGGPDFQFILGFNSSFATTMIAFQRQQNQEVTDEDRVHERWRQLLRELQIAGTDEFEVLVVDFLNSGLIDSSVVQQIIQRYLNEGEELVIRERVMQFFERCNWHPEISENGLVVELRALLPAIGKMDMYTVTSLASRAEDLTGDSSLSDAFIDGWCTSFREKNPDGVENASALTFGQAIHPAIQAEITAAQEKHHASTSLLEVCAKIVNTRSWGTREQQFMNSVTADSYEAAIRDATGEDLKLLLFKGLDFLKSRPAYDPHFGNVGQQFLEACQNIVRHGAGSRIGKLVQNLFKQDGREADLYGAPDVEQEG